MNELIAKASVTVDAPAEQVWQALTDPDLISRYMAGAHVTTDWQVGSPITYEGEWKGTTYRDKGTILEVVPQQRLKSTHFSPLSGEPDVPENYHVVTYELTPASGGATQVSVTQENNPDRAMVEESEKTWSMMLEGLKKVVEAERSRV